VLERAINSESRSRLRLGDRSDARLFVFRATTSKKTRLSRTGSSGSTFARLLRILRDGRTRGMNRRTNLGLNLRHLSRARKRNFALRNTTKTRRKRSGRLGRPQFQLYPPLEAWLRRVSYPPVVPPHRSPPAARRHRCITDSSIIVSRCDVVKAASQRRARMARGSQHPSFDSRVTYRHTEQEGAEQKRTTEGSGGREYRATRRDATRRGGK